MGLGIRDKGNGACSLPKKETLYPEKLRVGGVSTSELLGRLSEAFGSLCIKTHSDVCVVSFDLLEGAVYDGKMM
jgi:hypothetical protein